MVIYDLGVCILARGRALLVDDTRKVETRGKKDADEYHSGTGTHTSE